MIRFVVAMTWMGLAAFPSLRAEQPAYTLAELLKHADDERIPGSGDNLPHRGRAVEDYM